MVSSSKILTVSYGTFSCTVEGFEDPLAVVKDTTQFFRGVVKEDRFFGAEPPQFDAELAGEMMRAQIAADESDGRLTVRPALSQASSGALTAALSAVPARAVPQQPEAAPQEDTLPDDAMLEEAARLAEEAEAKEQAEIQTDVAAFDAKAQTEADHSPATVAALADADAEPDMIAPEATAPVAESVSPTAPESIAARLERIRNVVADSHEDATPEVDLEDDGPVDEESNFDNSTLSAMLADYETGNAPLESADTAPEDALSDETAQDDAWAGLTESTAIDDTYEEDTDFEDLIPDGSVSDVDLSSLVADSSVTGQDQSDSVETHADVVSAPVEEAVSEAGPQESVVAHAEPETAQEPIEQPAPEPARPALRARVVKVKRAVFDKAVSEGQLEEVEDDDQDDAALSRAEEDELARELEAVKAELSGDLTGWDDDEEEDLSGEAEWEQDLVDALDGGESDAETLDRDTPVDDVPADSDAVSGKDTIQAAVDGVRKAVKMASPARAMLTEKSVEDDDASRILDQTNTELEEPEGNRRRSAIAHLRAAVAATRADRLLGRKPDAEEQAEPYREDLATVVRPRRPQQTARTERPATPDTARPAPLKLVAEQRVEDSAQPVNEAPQTPVRPRRVSVADDPMPAGADLEGGFADYAESVGAQELPELLEAAAAYMSFVEGRDQFSRPQLMTTVRQAEQEDFSREDRLRSFGQLLREGKIEKTSGGRFTASERISFKPGRRAAG